MANDSMRITNLPDSGSKERVAYDLAIRIWTAEGADRNSEEIKAGTRKGLLDLYAECLYATAGYRKTDAT